MKTMSAMEVRRHFGSVLDEVRIKSETILLERAGRPIAMITPITPQSTPAIAGHLTALQNLKNANNEASDRGMNPNNWVANERTERRHEDIR